MTSHEMGDWTNVLAPNCNENGTDERVCTNEGCTYKETRVATKLGHKMGDWYTTLTPTCTEVGTQRRDCTRTDCNHYELEIVDKLGHDFATEFTVDVEATCTASGEQSRHCTRCSAVTDSTAIAKLDHSYNSGEITLKATAGSVGIKTYTCTDCGHAYTEEIAKLAPTIIEQDKTEWTEWVGDGTMTFRSNASYADFVEVRINGEKLSEEFYTRREGSTVIELNPEYMDSLENGDYKIEIVSLTGTATAEFSVNKKVMQNPWVWGSGSAVVFIGILVVLLWFAFRKKKH